MSDNGTRDAGRLAVFLVLLIPLLFAGEGLVKATQMGISSLGDPRFVYQQEAICVSEDPVSDQITPENYPVKTIKPLFAPFALSSTILLAIFLASTYGLATVFRED